MYQAGCRFFNGYKPCPKNIACNEQCPSRDIPETSILLVHLGAMGAVLRSTALLSMIKNKYPSSYITWVTEDHSKPLLENNPLIDKVLGLSTKDQLVLSSMNFDIGYFIDKSAEVAGLEKLAKPKEKFGFTTNPKTGAILPLNTEAQELWELGLDNHKKFYVNKKTELQLIAESLLLPFARDEYILRLSEAEKSLARHRHEEWSRGGRYPVIGLNTGTSGVLPYKTIPVSIWREIIALLQRDLEVSIVLLGGASDGERNNDISSGLAVVQSPTNRGLRDGMASMAATDLVITADSLGMHMAIALQKKIVAWFGPTCDHEMDLYDRGIKIKSELPCSPCWNRHCEKINPCCAQINSHQILAAVQSLVGTKLRAAEQLFSVSI